MGMEGNLERKNGNRETHSTQHLTEGSREKVWPGTLHKIICRRPTRHGKVNFDNLLTSFGDNHLSLPSVINRFGSVSVSVVNFVSGSRLQFSKGLTNMYEPATTSMYAAYDNIQRPPLKTFCTLAWRCLKREYPDWCPAVWCRPIDADLLRPTFLCQSLLMPVPFDAQQARFMPDPIHAGLIHALR